MDLIIPPQSETALALLEDDLTAAQDYLAQEKAEGTRAAYRSDFKIFSRYCDARGLSPMPASPEAVMAFISAEGRGQGLDRRPPDRRHPLCPPPAGHEPPANSEAVKATLRGIRRSIGAAPVKKLPCTADIVRQLLDAMPDTLKGNGTGR